jgi:hypothetical protein
MRNVVVFVLFRSSACAAAVLLAAPAFAVDLPSAPSSYPALTPNAADVAPNYWSGLYVGSGVSVWGGKGVRGGVGGEGYLGYDHEFDNGVVVGVRAAAGYAPFLWSTPRGFTQFAGTAFAGGEALVGYRMGQVTPYLITAVDIARPTNFTGAAFSPLDAANTVFSGPGAVQAVGMVGMGVTYQFSSNFSMGLEARVYRPGYGVGPWP